jgi:tRNA(adenine34) deaminase
MSLTPDDGKHLRAAIALSRTARAKGNEPYGAVLANDRGEVLMGAENTQVIERDCTGHAELNLLREASRRFPPGELSRCTVYASGEPCPMCAGAIYWGGISRVVYALAVESMAALAGPGADEIHLSCRDVLARGTRRVEVLGPALEEEARQVFEEYRK